MFTRDDATANAKIGAATRALIAKGYCVQPAEKTKNTLMITRMNHGSSAIRPGERK